jgi:DNA-binding transcriptional MerR regulator
MSTTTAKIPKRASYKSSDVCQLVGIEPYVLRSWTEEFPELGKTTANGNARVFRYRDVQLALRLKHLLFTEGLTLGGARRKLDEEQETARVEAETSTDETPVVTPSRDKQRVKQLRLELAAVKKDLKDLLRTLSRDGRQTSVPKAATVRQTKKYTSKDRKQSKEKMKAGR